MNARDLEFVRRKRMYVADISDWLSNEPQENTALMTVEEKELLLTRRQKRKALEAKKFVCLAGYPSEAEALAMIRDGNVRDIPHEPDKVKDYFDIYDVPIAAIRGGKGHGKTPHRQSSQVPKEGADFYIRCDVYGWGDIYLHRLNST